MSFVPFAWIASIGYGLVIITGKLTSKHTLKNPWLFNFLYNASLLLWTIPVALINHAGLPTHWEFIIATGICYALSTMCFVLALYKLDASTISPLFNFRIAFSVIMAALLIDETFSFWKYILIAVIFFFGLFTTIDERFHIKSFFQKPVAVALLGMIFTSLGGVTTNRAIALDTYWTVSLWIPIITMISLSFLFPKFLNDIQHVSSKPILVMLCIGGFDTIATFAANYAFSKNVALTSVIISLPVSMFLAVAFSIFAPNLLEKHSWRVYLVRFIAAGIMIISALRLT